MGPLSENYKPNPEYTSSIVSPYTSHVNETFESTFESGAENWSYMYGLLVAACVLVIVAAPSLPNWDTNAVLKAR